MKKLILVVSVFFFALLLASSGNWYIETNPTTGNPEAVWSAKGMSDSSCEIRYSYLDGREWAPSVMLTSDSIDDYDPRLAFDESGNRKATWWSDGDYERIKYSTLPSSGGSWSSPQNISGATENCRYPSIIAYSGTIYISYERINSSEYRDVLAAIGDSPDPTPTLISSTQRTDELRTKIHSSQGHLWVDWVHSDSNLGCSEYVNGSWSSASYESYSGESDIENGRDRIRVKIVEN